MNIKTICGGLAVTITASLNVAMANDQTFDQLPELNVNETRAALGKRLFFDNRLSGDGQLSCSSCHIPKFGFASDLPLSKAYPGSDGFRNVPSLINTSYKEVWMHDGRLGTNLNDVTREMITEDYLMNMDMRLMQERIKQDPIYVKMFADAGYGEPSNGGVRKAIPEFLNTLQSKNTPFDSNKLSTEAKRGYKIFKGKGNCVSCHAGPLFSDQRAHNTGVPENFDIFLDPMRHQTFLAFSMFMGVENYYNLKRDPGAHIITHQADGSQMGTFVTPSLRELKHTAPYMHNGMITTLKKVVSFYNEGGGTDRNKDSRIVPLDLSGKEQKDLVAFLESLSGDLLTGEAYEYTSRDYKYQVISDWLNSSN